MAKNRLVRIYDHLEEIILVILFIVMVLAVFCQVIMRYCFNSSLSWAEEFARLTFVWLTWIGVSIGERKGEHIKITMLADKMPFRAAHLMNIVSCIIVIIICGVTLYYGEYLTRFMLGSQYVSLHISYAWGYAAIPAGCALMILRILPSIYHSTKSVIKGEITLNSEKGGAA